MSRDYNKSMLGVLLESGTGDAMEDIEELCLTYDDYGALLRDCLSYFGGSKNWDNDAFDFLCEMVSEIYKEIYND